MRLLQSQLRGPGPIVAARTVGAHPEQRSAQIPVLWPRHVNGKTVMAPIHPSQIPPGWQAVQVHSPSRVVNCEDTGCPMYLNGWTEILNLADGSRNPRPGVVTEEDAASVWGRYNGQPPAVIHHAPGTRCPRIHKQRSTVVPPLYTVDGRVVLWNQFEDAIGGGIHRAQQIVTEGRS